MVGGGEKYTQHFIPVG